MTAQTMFCTQAPLTAHSVIDNCRLIREFTFVEIAVKSEYVVRNLPSGVINGIECYIADPFLGYIAEDVEAQESN